LSGTDMLGLWLTLRNMHSSARCVPGWEWMTIKRPHGRSVGEPGSTVTSLFGLRRMRPPPRLISCEPGKNIKVLADLIHVRLAGTTDFDQKALVARSAFPASSPSLGNNFSERGNFISVAEGADCRGCWAAAS
jgi:hypothetical protein